LILFNCVSTVQSREVDTALTYSVNQVEVTAEGTRLIGPIMLTLQPWIAHARGGQTVKTQDCSQQFNLTQLTVSDSRRRWAYIKRFKHCLSTDRVSFEAFKIHFGQAGLSISKLVFETHRTGHARLYGARLTCGDFLPLSLSASRGTLSREQVVLKDITLGVNGFPIGWFPTLNVSKSGRPGILPPTFSIQPDQLRLGVPIYLPLGNRQALTLTPGYRSQRRGTDRVVGSASYEWHQHQQRAGALRVLGDHRFIAVQSAGSARLKGWLLSTQGSTRFGVRTLENDPNLNLQTLTGFSRGGLSLGWSNQQVNWGLQLDRALNQDQRLTSFSRLVHRIGFKTDFKFGYLGFGHSTQVRLEPDQIWLSEGTVMLFLQERWWGLSAMSQTQVHLQYGTHAPFMSEGQAILGVPTLEETLKLTSLWSRDYASMTHKVGVQGGMSTHIRVKDRVSGLDTRMQPGTRLSQRIYAGFISSMAFSKTQAEIQFKGVHLTQSTFAGDIFPETSIVLEHEQIALEANYAYARSILLQSRLSSGSSLALHTTYFARRPDTIPSDLLLETLIDIKPTVGQHLGWQGKQFQVMGSVWFPQNHRKLHAGAIALTQHPQCECFSWTSEIKYIHQSDNLWLTVQLELELEDRSRSHEQYLSVGVVP
jgi:hypothetical protein